MSVVSFPFPSCNSYSIVAGCYVAWIFLYWSCLSCLGLTWFIYVMSANVHYAKLEKKRHVLNNQPLFFVDNRQKKGKMHDSILCSYYLNCHKKFHRFRYSSHSPLDIY